MSTQTAAETFGTHSPMGDELRPCQCQHYTAEIWTGEVPEGGDPNEFVNYVGTGCYQSTTRDFAPGHDAKLKSLLIKAGVNGWGIATEAGGVLTVHTPQQVADQFGFGHQVASGIERAIDKALARVVAKADKAAKKAANLAAKTAEQAKSKDAMAAKKAQREAEAAAKPQAPATQAMRIKVGAHVYDAEVDTQTGDATYTTKGGQTKTIGESKWTLATS